MNVFRPTSLRSEFATLCSREKDEAGLYLHETMPAVDFMSKLEPELDV